MRGEAETDHLLKSLRAGGAPVFAPEVQAPVFVAALLRFDYAMCLKRIFPRGGRLLALGPVDSELQDLLEDAEGPAISSEPRGGPPFDGAASGLAEATTAELERGAAELCGLLAPGAPVVAAVAGRGRRRPSAGAASAVAGEEDARRILGEAVAWRKRFGLGALLPVTPVSWPARFPQAFALLAVADRLVRGWPVVGSRGACIVLEGNIRERR
jgi:hypothetical protein